MLSLERWSSPLCWRMSGVHTTAYQEPLFIQEVQKSLSRNTTTRLRSRRSQMVAASPPAMAAECAAYSHLSRPIRSLAQNPSSSCDTRASTQHSCGPQKNVIQTFKCLPLSPLTLGAGSQSHISVLWVNINLFMSSVWFRL